MDEKPSKMTVKELKELLEKYDESFIVEISVGLNWYGDPGGDLSIYDNKRDLVAVLLENNG